MLSAMRATCSRATAPLRAACSRSCRLLSARQSPSFGCFAALSPAQETCALRSRPSFAFSRAFSSGVPEHTVLLMPALSPTMTQGNIAAWLKKVGDKISPGDAIAELETDKATLGFEAVESGYLAAVMVPVGAKDVQVGTPLCIVVDSAGHVPAFSNYKHAATPKAAAPAVPASAPPPPSHAKPSAAAASPPPAAPASHHVIPSNLLAGPAVLRLLHENPHVNALAIAGSGPKGRLLKGDVLAAIAGAPASAPASARAAASSAAAPAAAKRPSAPATAHVAAKSQQPIGYTRSGAHRSFVQTAVDVRWAQCNCQVACASCLAKFSR